jgi:hypothetical protein
MKKYNNGKMVSYDGLLRDILKQLQLDNSTPENEIFRLLFILSFDKLENAEVTNPLTHHLIVLKNMLIISKEENLDLLVAGAIAVLHDIWPIKKIRAADVETEEDTDKKRLLDQQRIQNRKLHMREGSALAKRQLLLLNEYLGKIFYTDKDIDTVCEVIKIHDNPSIGIPIPKSNKMAVSFREADRLWMLSDAGFAFDLRRDSKKMKDNTDNRSLASKRLEHVIKRYQQERNLYSNEDGPFQDNKLFFRTEAAYRLYQQYLQERKHQYR